MTTFQYPRENESCNDATQARSLSTLNEFYQLRPCRQNPHRRGRPRGQRRGTHESRNDILRQRFLNSQASMSESLRFIRYLGGPIGFFALRQLQQGRVCLCRGRRHCEPSWPKISQIILSEFPRMLHKLGAFANTIRISEFPRMLH